MGAWSRRLHGRQSCCPADEHSTDCLFCPSVIPSATTRPDASAIDLKRSEETVQLIKTGINTPIDTHMSGLSISVVRLCPYPKRRSVVASADDPPLTRPAIDPMRKP